MSVQSINLIPIDMLLIIGDLQFSTLALCLKKKIVELQTTDGIQNEQPEKVFQVFSKLKKKLPKSSA